MRKSRALALGAWDTTTQIMDIPYRTDVKILGFHFTNKVNTSVNETWPTVTTRVGALAQDTYYRDLSLDRRIHFVHEYLLAKIWYAAQIYPPPAECIRQLNTTISWFIWRGEIFRGPLSTLQRGKMDRDLVNVWAKSSALFIYRIQAQSQRDGSLTAGRLKKWNLHSRTENPSLPDRIPASMEYLCSYVVDVAYTPRQGRPESAMAYKKWLYTALQTIHNASFTPQEMRIARMWQQ